MTGCNTHIPPMELAMLPVMLPIRFKRLDTHEQLRRRAAELAESTSTVGERLIEEGLRMETHPGIVFRSGPSGRRAGLAAGPDVWEVIGLLRDLPGSVEERVTTTAALLGLTAGQVRTTSRYYAEFTDEIDAEIARNEAEADRELAIWENEQKLLSG